MLVKLLSNQPVLSSGIISALYTSTYPEHIEETVMIDAVLPRAMKPEETVSYLVKLFKYKTKNVYLCVRNLTYSQKE